MARPNKTDNTAGVNRKEERRGRIKKGKYQCGVNVSTEEKKRKKKKKKKKKKGLAMPETQSCRKHYSQSRLVSDTSSALVGLAVSGEWLQFN